MATKYIGDLVFTEKYEKDGETKNKYTNVGGLFFNEEKETYSVKFLGQWLNVYSKKKTPTENRQDMGDEITLNDIPF